MSTQAAVHETSAEKLRNQARELHRLLNELPQHQAVTDTLDYILGALYALHEAAPVFRNRPAAYAPEYHAYLANYALNLAEDKCIDSVWRAGFFFNSGIQRLAAAFDRLPKMMGAKLSKRVNGKRIPTTAKERMKEVNRGNWANWQKVYDEVNAFKHKPEGRAAGRMVPLDDAVEASSEVLDLITRSVATLVGRYS